MRSVKMGKRLSWLLLSALCILAFVSAEFELPPLPYDYGDLEPDIDKATMKLHHDKQEGMELALLNKALEQGPEYTARMNVTELVMSVGSRSIPRNMTRAVRNFGGSFWNHEFFWKVMRKPKKDSKPPIDQMSPELREHVLDVWGDFEGMRAEFNDTALNVFGSGWTWLCIDEEGDLNVTSTQNQDNPLMVYLVDNPCWPILGLDVWEHSYFLKWQHRRWFYLGAWWNVVNWDQVSKNYDMGMEVLAANKAAGVKGFNTRAALPTAARRLVRQ